MHCVLGWFYRNLGKTLLPYCDKIDFVELKIFLEKGRKSYRVYMVCEKVNIVIIIFFDELCQFKL